MVLLSLLVLKLILPTVAYAVCPVCTIAVAGGLGLSRYLGIDDSVSSLWIGGLILSSSFWLVDWLKKKKPEFPIFNYQFPIILAMYLLVLGPLVWAGVIGHPLNTIFGIDKIVFGTLVGSVVFLLAIWADKKVREKKGKQLFNYQKVVFPVALLALTSLIIYYFGGYLY